MPDNSAFLIESRLRNRERQVLRLLLQGCANREIAAEMNISVQGVKNYLRLIYEVLGVNTRLEAALWVINHPAAYTALGVAKL